MCKGSSVEPMNLEKPLVAGSLVWAARKFYMYKGFSLSVIVNPA